MTKLEEQIVGEFRNKMISDCETDHEWEIFILSSMKQIREDERQKVREMVEGMKRMCDCGRLATTHPIDRLCKMSDWHFNFALDQILTALNRNDSIPPDFPES